MSWKLFVNLKLLSWNVDFRIVELEELVWLGQMIAIAYLRTSCWRNDLNETSKGFCFLFLLTVCLPGLSAFQFQSNWELRLLNEILECSSKSKTVNISKTTNIYHSKSRMWTNLLSSFKTSKTVICDWNSINIPYENIYSYRKGACKICVQSMKSERIRFYWQFTKQKHPTSNDHSSNRQRKPWEGWRIPLVRDVDENWKINMPIRHNKYRASQQTDFVYQSSTTTE